MIVVGTRPEAIKMAPVQRALAAIGGMEPVLVSTGQHRSLLDSALVPLGLEPRHELAVMQPGQTPNEVAARVLSRLPPLLNEERPAAVVVQGDTTTVLAAALAAYHLGIPVGHVEAGLRTYDHQNPFPEEANRQLVDRVAAWCFAPTERSRDNLLAERIPESVVTVTGNTAVDSLLWMLERAPSPCVEPPFVLMTLHRRESFGGPLEEILNGVGDFLSATPDAKVVWPVHRNPRVIQAAEDVVENTDRMICLEPLPYAEFAALIGASRLLLTDSGGLQEEAPSLGKRVLVARDTTERPEGVEAGRNRLVGRSRTGVCKALREAWIETPYEGPLPAPNPFGDGQAGQRIAAQLKQDLSS